jgi:hypothetical protein
LLAAKKGINIILSDPVRYALLHLKTIPTNLLPIVGDWLRTFGVNIGGSGTLSVIRSNGIIAGIRHYFKGRWIYLFIALPTVVWLTVVYFLAGIGGFLQLQENKFRIEVIFLLGTIGYFLVAPGGAAIPRFRVPIAPMLSILAGLGWIEIPKICLKILGIMKR